jgi:hypothetical protein
MGFPVSARRNVSVTRMRPDRATVGTMTQINDEAQIASSFGHLAFSLSNRSLIRREGRRDKIEALVNTLLQMAVL